MTAKLRMALSVGLAVLTVALGSLTAGVTADDATARATLHNGAWANVGVVKFIQQGDKVLVKVNAAFADSGAYELASGFHGFHIHAVGTCTAPSFTSAGGHYNPGGSSVTHKDHAGDMPVLLVNEDRTAEARFVTDRFDVADIVGKAVIVHTAADNYANIPGRYHSHDATFNPTDAMGPDSDTKAKGDAGTRNACGVIESSS